MFYDVITDYGLLAVILATIGLIIPFFLFLKKKMSRSYYFSHTVFPIPIEISKDKLLPLSQLVITNKSNKIARNIRVRLNFDLKYAPWANHEIKHADNQILSDEILARDKLVINLYPTNELNETHNPQVYIDDELTRNAFESSLKFIFTDYKFVITTSITSILIASSLIGGLFNTAKAISINNKNDRLAEVWTNYKLAERYPLPIVINPNYYDNELIKELLSKDENLKEAIFTVNNVQDWDQLFNKNKVLILDDGSLPPIDSTMYESLRKSLGYKF